MKPITKGIIMTLLSCLVALIANGMPSSTVSWEVAGISILGTLIVYVGQSYVFPSTSLFNGINLRDLMKGLLVAVGNGLSTWAASALTSTEVNWKSLLSGVGVIFIGYLAKQFKSETTGIPPTKE